jgi:predicted Fe-Mo cluster-binding NifX family protein
MKIAFTTSGSDLDAPLDKRFGRAPAFLVYDSDSAAYEIIENTQNLNAAQGAGIQSAETVIRFGAGAIVTSNCGPKAFRVLSSAGVKIYNTDAVTVAEALERFNAGTLIESTDANVDGHW